MKTYFASIALALTALVALQPPPARAAALAPGGMAYQIKSGSIFTTNALVQYTNCVAVNQNTTIAATNATVIPVLGATAIAFTVDIVNTNPPGATNNGIFRFNFAESVNETTFSTGTNGFWFDIDGSLIPNGRAVFTVPLPGCPTNRTSLGAQQTGNIFGGVSSIKLIQIGSTNAGGYWITNTTYKVILPIY